LRNNIIYCHKRVHYHWLRFCASISSKIQCAKRRHSTNATRSACCRICACRRTGSTTCANGDAYRAASSSDVGHQVIEEAIRSSASAISSNGGYASATSATARSSAARI
jgi:hypothetical protein